MLEGQMLIDFAQELRRVPKGYRYCPCGKLVFLGDEPVYVEDAAGMMRAWHRECRAFERDEQALKRARRKG